MTSFLGEAKPCVGTDAIKVYGLRALNKPSPCSVLHPHLDQSPLDQLPQFSENLSLGKTPRPVTSPSNRTGTIQHGDNSLDLFKVIFQFAEYESS